jgi:hypothetical protein
MQHSYHLFNGVSENRLFSGPSRRSGYGVCCSSALARSAVWYHGSTSFVSIKCETRCAAIRVSKNSARKSSRDVAMLLIHIEALLIYRHFFRHCGLSNLESLSFQLFFLCETDDLQIDLGGNPHRLRIRYWFT